MNILSITSISNNTTYFTSNDNDVSQLEAEDASDQFNGNVIDTLA